MPDSRGKRRRGIPPGTFTAARPGKNGRCLDGRLSIENFRMRNRALPWSFKKPRKCPDPLKKVTFNDRFFYP